MGNGTELINFDIEPRVKNGYQALESISNGIVSATAPSPP